MSPGFRSKAPLLAMVLVLCATGRAMAGEAAALERVAGTIKSVDDSALVITTAGQDLTLKIAPNTRVLLNSPATQADIDRNAFIGASAVKTADGRLTATEIHIFPEAMRGLGEGHRPWFAPQLTMTNGNVVDVGGSLVTRETQSGTMTLTVSYAGGQQQIAVDASTPITRVEPGSIASLRAGNAVSCLVRLGENEAIAQLISVDGHF